MTLLWRLREIIFERDAVGFCLCSIAKYHFEVCDERMSKFLVNHFHVNLVVSRRHIIANLYCSRRIITQAIMGKYNWETLPALQHCR